MSVAQNIRAAREYHNYTQRYVAARLGISTTAYSKIERGASMPGLARLRDIAAILHTTAEALVARQMPAVPLAEALQTLAEEVRLLRQTIHDKLGPLPQ
ncbi:helix-turn-helix domain-containing protein [Chitinophaga lutea]